ncbi:hypothetical protein PanWU01x14_118220 [Parasponia andersonii]|uniref:Uncharacterized protein n=1 Tax=Parasponia andersonii TaxID=3476 RepID=A0A2P5CWD0_PARAD|nr:hypothetical protein PanWU01x14_118220 [Parasponia andersonii]
MTTRLRPRQTSGALSDRRDPIDSIEPHKHLRLYTWAYPTNNIIYEFRLASYCAQVKALSRICEESPTKGLGGVGSNAIHHPTGILTAVIPLVDMKLKSSSVM